MNGKNIRRLIAAIMTIVCFFAYVVYEPAVSLAQTIGAEQELTENIDEMNAVWDEGEKGSEIAYSPIVGELLDLRSEDIKQLRRADGAVEMVMYPDAVHYEKDGVWEAIDNTLVKTENSEKEEVYENTASDLVVRFNASRQEVTIEYQGEVLSFERITDVPSYAAVVENEKPDHELTDEEQDELWRFPAELSSTIKYLPVEPDPESAEKEVEYRLNGKRLSEFITLDRASEEAPVYSYRIGGTLVPSVEGSTVLFLNADGETVLKFSAPYMADAKGEICYDFEISAEQDEEGYIYRMIPSEEWLCSAEREFPVVIDPEVETNFRSNVDNASIRSSAPTQNYGSHILLNVGDSYRSLIRLTQLPTLKAGDVIIDANIVLTRYGNASYASTGKEVDGYAILSDDWVDSSVTWNSFSNLNGGNPANYNKVETLALAPDVGYRTAFNVTPLLKKWVAGEHVNGGIVLVSSNNSYCPFWSSRSNEHWGYHPYFRIIYINSTGLESRFSYSSQSIGRAGTGSVNLYSGNLTMSFADAEINNGTMPISVSHVYNTNDKDTDIGYGKGWRLNYAQYIEAVSLASGDDNVIYYEYIDGDGTRHYYKKETNTKYVNELDTDSVLTIDESNYTLTISDKGDNKLIFSCGYFYLNNDTTHKVYLGHLTKIKDANGNETQITYDPTSVNGSALKNMRITSISEKLHGNSSVGQTITFAYTNDKLSSITVPNGLNRSYTYTNDDLTSVSSADSKNCTYTYSEHRLTQAKNIDNYNVNYAYDSSGRVISASEKANTTAGNSLAYDYAWNVTTVTDDQDRDVIHQFNDAGQAVSIRNVEGQAVFAAYGSGNNNPTKLTAVSKMQDTVVNLLDNHGFDIGSYGSGWTRTDDAIFYAGYPYTGANSVRLSANNYVEQTAAVAAGNTYTFSAYFTGASGGYVKVLNGSTVLAESDTVFTYGTTGTDWSRGVCTFTVPSGVSSVKVRIGKNGDNTSYTYTDAAQLEIGETPNRYNMLVNSDFTNGTNRYSTNGLTSSDTVVTDSNASHPTSLSTNVMKLIGSATTSKHVYQDISVRNGQQGDTYSFGGWCRSNSVPLSTQIYSYDPVQTRSYGVKCLKVQFYQDSTFRNEVTAYFNADTEDWQFACSSAVAGASYDKVRLVACFDYTRNEAYFDGLQLYREQFSQSYTYDSNGNLTGYHSLIGQEPTLTYDSNNNVTSSKDALNHTTTYTYDSHHNLLTSTSPTGVVTTNTYDTNGSVTSTKVGNSTDYIKTSTTYDSASALATAVTDARGNSVTYGYDSTTRQQTSITDPKGNVSTYSYGYASSMLRLASLTSDGTGTVNYTYDTYGKLTQIGRGITNYKFAYDSWGRSTTTKVGNTTLSTNSYDAYGRLSMVSYGNGFKTRYEYDSLDRTSKIYQGTASNASSTAAYEFIYNGEGDLYELRNYKTHRATFFEYDHAGRCMASTEKTFTGGNGSAISYTGTVAGYKYEYDLNNSLTKLTCELIGTSWSTTYSYDNDNRPTTTLLHNGRSFVNTYDGMGRITSVKLKNGSSTILNTAITYVSGSNGSKTALVSTYKNGNDSAYNYEYDANGNITKIWRGSSTYDNATEKVLYTYDSANQLIQEDLYYGSGNSSNVTYQYSYDQWGNITSKKTYAYQNTSGTALSEDTYMYGNLQWGDKLLKFNGQTISYDSMGNPTSYLGTTLSWQGKQLTTYVGSSKTISFSYNEDGLRLKKTVNNVDTNYYYNGSVLMAMTSGTIYQRFSYDASGKVVSVDYSENSGSTYITYYYLRNAQGDIVKLIDGSGATVVEYAYDSWGKKLSTTGTLATTLGKYQPFRYRGYVYDEETQWYYLQSRYYDPAVRRFISADVYLTTGQGVTGHNAYAYCGNNPIARIDDEGEFWHIVIGAAIGAVIGAVSSVVGQVVSGQEINWGAVAVSAASGAISGAINAACPCMGLVATGVVNGAIGAATHAATELAYGRTPTVEGVLAAGITSGVMAVGARYIGNKLGGQACFIAGTLVLTCAGVKAIETITDGDYVYATDPETGGSGYKRVLHAFDKETYELIKVKVDGETITTTPTHPFYVPQQGWTEAAKLTAGDILVTCNGEYVVVEQIQHELLETPITVYNFEVEDYHTYSCFRTVEDKGSPSDPPSDDH